jgi:fructose/tagatose bisphosphate aldolase
MTPTGITEGEQYYTMPKNKKSVELNNIDFLVEMAVFADDPPIREEHRRIIREMAAGYGIRPASIQGLYEASGRGAYHKLTVPAINIRGITYPVARSVFRIARKYGVGAFIFEIARSEMEYTRQSPAEYAACILAAAIREGFKGPVFLQGDHFQVRRATYRLNAEAELNDIKKLIRASIEAGFYNIDIDASTLVDISDTDLNKQQAKNIEVTAEMTRFIRSIQPEGVTISIGGEIGEIGQANSTPDDLRAFMDGYLKLLGDGIKGISKISVQTGTTHGGVVLPDGSIARVNIDFDTLKELSRIAREEYRMGGAVQHGASTLPDEAFDMFPKTNTLEVHLATGFQNIIYDSPHFPQKLLTDLYRHLDSQYSQERKTGETEEQFIYKTRKRAFGDFKKELWNIPESSLGKIMEELQNRLSLMFHKLNVVNTIDLVRKYVTVSFV